LETVIPGIWMPEVSSPHLSFSLFPFPSPFFFHAHPLPPSRAPRWPCPVARSPRRPPAPIAHALPGGPCSHRAPPTATLGGGPRPSGSAPAPARPSAAALPRHARALGGSPVPGNPARPRPCSRASLGGWSGPAAPRPRPPAACLRPGGLARPAASRPAAWRPAAPRAPCGSPPCQRPARPASRPHALASAFHALSPRAASHAPPRLASRQLCALVALLRAPAWPRVPPARTQL
jgi:hypothetical protein